VKLEKIVLSGFKSFADKTEFTFDQPVTAIVGPNGCGKSNVVDAIKWVLGTQSPKSLRSGQMSDVIFSGSSSRKASGMAQVTLGFSDVGQLNIGQDSLEIARRLYRSGESEYLINGNTCRLKDIRELFMDTGVGVSAYSIIEQGQIEMLLHASKVDRRLIFEEAAGISKYKAHKKEALRKLDRTEQNLLRLADIITEVQRQLRSIKLQAGKARNYLQYSEKLKGLRVNYSLAQYHKIVSQTTSSKNALAQTQTRFGTIVANVAKYDSAMSRLGGDIITSEQQINQCDNSLVAAKSKIEQQVDRIDMLKMRIEELDQRKENASEQARQFTEQTTQFTDELAQCQDRLEVNEKSFADKNERLSEVEEIINEINAESANIEVSLEDEKSGIIDIVRRTAQLHNEIHSMGSYRTNLSGQKDRLSGRADVAKEQLSVFLTEKAQNQTRLNDINKVIGQLQESLDEKRTQMHEFDKTYAMDNEQLTAMKEKRSGLSSELNILADMEAKKQGLSNTIKEILSAQSDPAANRCKYIEGILADIVSADSEYADIVEAALEHKTDALVINSTSEFLADKDMAGKLDSRVTVICADRLGPFVDATDLSKHPAVRGRVVEFVSYDNKYARLVWNLLGHTILVESIDAAIELSRRFGGKYRFVTDDGLVFDGKEIISAGPLGKATGLISRKSRIHQLESELVQIGGQISGLQNQLEQNKRRNEHLADLCKDFRTSIYEANTERVNTESKLNLIEQNIGRLSDEQPVIASEIEMLQQEISQSVQKEYDSKQKLEELEEVNTQRSDHIEQLETELTEKKASRQSHTTTLTELKVEIGQIAEQQNSARQRITSLQSQIQHARMAGESTRTDLLTCDEQLTQAQREILASEAKVSELFVDKEKAQKLSTDMHHQVEQMLAEQKQTEHLLRESRSSQAEIEQKIHEVELELSQLTVKEEDLTLRVQEELQIELAQAYENFQQEDIDWEEVRSEIAELKGKIERLGNVNVDAIEEQEQLQERYEFLADQAQDLNTGKAQLEQLIARINKESREKFRVTFEQIKSNFQVIFRKLFGGGKADVMLEDPDDILECGIEIIARPPGKETRTISLLSGGEKSLTALALLFAVFKTKPSPFCFLDEVDAALDEANNERFNMIVRQFQENSQFIIITHSKRTMSIADVLFGVTMQTQGVSKKISIRFDQADVETDVAVA